MCSVFESAYSLFSYFDRVPDGHGEPKSRQGYFNPRTCVRRCGGIFHLMAGFPKAPSAAFLPIPEKPETIPEGQVIAVTVPLFPTGEVTADISFHGVFQSYAPMDT